MGDNADVSVSYVEENNEFECFAVKVRGLSHVKKGTDCQDSFAVEQFGAYLIASVADGHGSDKHPLSKFGADIAVECSNEILRELCKKGKIESVFSAIKKEYPQRLFDEWTKRVEVDFCERNIDNDFFKPAEVHKKYGTTCMFCVAAENKAFFGILDGNAIVVKKGVAFEPLPDDDALVGSEARSLCKKKDALSAWRFGHTENAEFFALTTDGFRNSFGEDEDNGLFLAAVSEICVFAKKNGAKTALEGLPVFLKRCTNEGSGDDITICCFLAKQGEK